MVMEQWDGLLGAQATSHTDTRIESCRNRSGGKRTRAVEQRGGDALQSTRVNPSRGWVLQKTPPPPPTPSHSYRRTHTRRTASIRESIHVRPTHRAAQQQTFNASCFFFLDFLTDRQQPLQLESEWSVLEWFRDRQAARREPLQYLASTSET